MNPDETQQTDDALPTDNRALLLALLLLLLRSTRDTLEELSRGYLAGHLSLIELHDGIVSVLSDSHAHAAYLGRQLAGDVSPFGAADVAFAAVVMEGEAEFLDGLLQDFSDGKYAPQDTATATDAVSAVIPPLLAARLLLWAKRLRGTANNAWTFAQGAGVQFVWQLGATFNHCEQCPEYAAGSPYTSETLPTTPGSADCLCLSACKCTLAIVDGDEAFPPPDF